MKHRSRAAYLKYAAHGPHGTKRSSTYLRYLGNKYARRDTILFQDSEIGTEHVSQDNLILSPEGKWTLT